MLFSQFLLKVLQGQSCIFRRKTFSSLRQTAKSIIETKASKISYYACFFSLLSFLTFIIRALISGHRRGSLKLLGNQAGKDVQAGGAGGDSALAPATSSLPVPSCSSSVPSSLPRSQHRGLESASYFQDYGLHSFLFKKIIWGILLLIFSARRNADALPAINVVIFLLF